MATGPQCSRGKGTATGRLLCAADDVATVSQSSASPHRRSPSQFAPAPGSHPPGRRHLRWRRVRRLAGWCGLRGLRSNPLVCLSRSPPALPAAVDRPSAVLTESADVDDHERCVPGGLESVGVTSRRVAWVAFCLTPCPCSPPPQLQPPSGRLCTRCPAPPTPAACALHRRGRCWPADTLVHVR